MTEELIKALKAIGYEIISFKKGSSQIELLIQKIPDAGEGAA